MTEYHKTIESGSLELTLIGFDTGQMPKVEVKDKTTDNWLKMDIDDWENTLQKIKNLEERWEEMKEKIPEENF